MKVRKDRSCERLGQMDRVKGQEEWMEGWLGRID